MPCELQSRNIEKVNSTHACRLRYRGKVARSCQPHTQQICYRLAHRHSVRSLCSTWLAANQLPPAITTPNLVCKLRITSSLRLLLCIPSIIFGISARIAAVGVAQMQLALSCKALSPAVGPVAPVTITSSVTAITITERAWGLTIVVETLVIIGTLVDVLVAVAHGAQGACSLGGDVLCGGPSCCSSKACMLQRLSSTSRAARHASCVTETAAGQAVSTPIMWLALHDESAPQHMRNCIASKERSKTRTRITPTAMLLIRYELLLSTKTPPLPDPHLPLSCTPKCWLRALNPGQQYHGYLAASAACTAYCGSSSTHRRLLSCCHRACHLLGARLAVVCHSDSTIRSCARANGVNLAGPITNPEGSKQAGSG